MICPACGHPQRADAPAPCRCIVLADMHPCSPDLTREQAEDATARAIETIGIEFMGVALPNGGERLLAHHVMQAYDCRREVMAS